MASSIGQDCQTIVLSNLADIVSESNLTVKGDAAMGCAASVQLDTVVASRTMRSGQHGASSVGQQARRIGAQRQRAAGQLNYDAPCPQEKAMTNMRMEENVVW